MELVDQPTRDPRAQVAAVHADLVELLDGLDDARWTVPTDAGHWRVRDVALHLLGEDLGGLSRERDQDTSGLLPVDGDHAEFVRSLDAKNEAWVVGTHGLSRRVVVDLLRWVGSEVAAFQAGIDLDEPSIVLWASRDPVPRWFDLCRDLTEHWVHQQHIRDAVGRPGSHDRFLPDVLETFVWAFPHQYRAEAPEGTSVQLDFGAGGTWHLVRSGDRWRLERGAAGTFAARMDLPASVAWRQLTGLAVAASSMVIEGPDHLVQPLLAVRGILA